MKTRLSETRIAKGTEFSRIDCGDIENIHELIKGFGLFPPGCLGANIVYPRGEIFASHFVGQVWLESGKVLLKVDPKHDKTVDYFKMFLTCLKNQSVAKHITTSVGANNGIGSVFYFWPEQKMIPVESDLLKEITILIISAYLQELNDLCKRHIIHNFIKVEDNLLGRVKGKIMVSQNVIKNTLQGRIDRIYCRFQIHSIDTIENQIIMAALEQSLKYLRTTTSFDCDILWSWAGAASQALSGVSLKRIFPSDFQGIGYSGLKQAYRQPHSLAKLILSLLGSDPTAEISESMSVLPPFAIDMNELFERYCEALIRSKYTNSVLWCGYKSNDLGAPKFRVRPDFLMKGKVKAILDAKYKYAWGNPGQTDEDGVIRNDIYQVLAYSRHSKVIEMINLDPRDTVIYILYPCVDYNGNAGRFSLEQGEQIFDAFDIPFYRVPVPIPTRSLKTALPCKFR